MRKVSYKGFKEIEATGHVGKADATWGPCPDGIEQCYPGLPGVSEEAIHVRRTKEHDKKWK